MTNKPNLLSALAAVLLSTLFLGSAVLPASVAAAATVSVSADA